jgi:hypothetical protein
MAHPCGRSTGTAACCSTSVWAVALHGVWRGGHLIKLALYLPNFRDKVTVEELEDLTRLAEELEFDSVWTLDRIVVPEASDRQELQ